MGYHLCQDMEGKLRMNTINTNKIIYIYMDIYILYCYYIYICVCVCDMYNSIYFDLYMYKLESIIKRHCHGTFRGAALKARCCLLQQVEMCGPFPLLLAFWMRFESNLLPWKNMMQEGKQEGKQEGTSMIKYEKLKLTC